MNSLINQTKQCVIYTHFNQRITTQYLLTSTLINKPSSTAHQCKRQLSAEFPTTRHHKHISQIKYTDRYNTDRFESVCILCIDRQILMCIHFILKKKKRDRQTATGKLYLSAAVRLCQRAGVYTVFLFQTTHTLLHASLLLKLFKPGPDRQPLFFSFT